MNLQPQILELPPMWLAGLSMEMTLADNRSAQLWQQFMPRHRELSHSRGDTKYAVQVYALAPGMPGFTPLTPFVKWASMEVSGPQEELPEGMAYLHFTGGLYAVFLHRGDVSAYVQTMRYIFAEWLPQSDYLPDLRPHVEVLDARYRHNSPDSEEDIWIPLRPR